MRLHQLRHFLLLLFAFCSLLFSPTLIFAAPQQLQVSANKRFLQTVDGQPFFWQADTAWQLQRATPAEVIQYLNDRQNKGFTVIQGPTITGDTDVRNGTNYRGDRNDTPGSPNEGWFEHIDYIVNQAEARNMYVALVVIWSTKHTLISSSSQAYTYGQWLGNRYKDKNNVIWIVAGEYTMAGTSSTIMNKWDQMAQGLKNGSGGKHLVTIHGTWGPTNADRTSSTYFHTANWLDFNMWQTSQDAWTESWNLITSDYNKSPTKPVVDGEPTYEGWWETTNYRNDAIGMRRRAYWAVFAGALGHTYGAHGIWDWHKPGESSTTGDAWNVALNFEGSGDMQHVKNLMLSRPYFNRIPDQSLITSNAGSSWDHISATRDSTGTYGFIYIPSGQSVTVAMSKISGQVKTWWYNPSTGSSQDAGTYANSGTRSFTPPSGSDWVLVLDDNTKGYGVPGSGTVQPTSIVPTNTPAQTSPTPTSGPITGQGMIITSPLQLDRTSVSAGQTISGTVTYKNDSSTTKTITEFVIAARPPGGSNEGGPYLDFTPSTTNITFQPGQSRTITASRTISSSDPTGQWYAFSTYNDGSWHDAASSQNKIFTVGTTQTITNTPTQSIPTPTSFPQTIPNAPSWFYQMPANIRGFLEQLYLTVYVWNRDSNMAHLLEGLVN